MRDRDAGIGRSGNGRRDARHNLEGDAATGQCQCFLSAAPEDEGVAALEPRYAQPCPRPLHQQRVDAVLRQLLLPPRLASEHPLGRRWRVVQQRRVRQPVVDDHVAPLQSLAALHGQQAGVAGARAYQVNLAGWWGHSEMVP